MKKDTEGLINATSDEAIPSKMPPTAPVPGKKKKKISDAQKQAFAAMAKAKLKK